MHKIFILILLAFALFGCATNLHPHQIPSDKRLVFGRLGHYNGKENYNHATTLKYKTANAVGTFQAVDTSHEYNNPGYFWALIDREVNQLVLKEIDFSIDDHPMSMGKYLNNGLAVANFRPGPLPLYLGDIVLVTEPKNHEAKLLEYQDHQREAENFLRKNFDYDHPLTKALFTPHPE